MDGENHGKPYFLMDDLGETHHLRKHPFGRGPHDTPGIGVWTYDHHGYYSNHIFKSLDDPPSINGFINWVVGVKKNLIIDTYRPMG